MATKTLFAQVKLRRDNDYNYEAKKNTFIPLNGEICLVDVAGKGLKAKVGDGVTVWANLPYTDEDIYNAIDSLIVSGELINGIFYKDSTHTSSYVGQGETIYIDTVTSKVYIYNNEYICLNETLPTASATEAGIVKLYNTYGSNVDGTMTQKAITENLEKKVSAKIDNTDSELLIFSTEL